MNAQERRERLAQIEGYAKALAQSTLVMDQRRHILEPLVNDNAVRTALEEKFKNTYGARAYNQLVPLLAQDLVRDLARLYLDKGSKAASLANAFRKVSEPTVRKALRAKFAAIPDKWNKDEGPIGELSEEQSDRIREKFRKHDREGFEKSFDDGWTRVVQALADLAADPRAVKIKTFRDKYHVHLEMTPLGEEPRPFDVKALGLTYSDILAFQERYKSAVFEFIRIVTGNVYDIDGFSKNHRTSASDMWRILAGVEKQKAKSSSSGRVAGGAGRRRPTKR